MVSYCQNCNCELGEETESCPACGYSPADQKIVNINNSAEKNTQRSEQYMGKALTAAFLFGVIWVIVAIQEGIKFIREGIVYTIYQDSMFSIAYHQLGQMYLISGPLLVISGILIILSCIYIFQLRNYRKASIFYLIGSALAVVSGVAFLIQYSHYWITSTMTASHYILYGYSIFFGIAGIIFYVLIRKEKNNFNS